MTTRIYDSNQVQVAFAGIPVQGYADGDFLTITAETDAFTSVVGTDGEVSRSKSNDRRATVEIILMSTSPTNDLLSAVHVADLNSPGGAGVGALLVTDLNGTSLFTAGNAWVVKAPDVTYGREANERTWTLQVDSLVAFTGGNL
jgi:hypothetical protein